ncbi:MAG: SCO family protein [Proteobacteria bacterium]|jgi:protein SCO1/2|nr:SCO family protein [Pseudomonadota bacterium]
MRWCTDTAGSLVLLLLAALCAPAVHALGVPKLDAEAALTASQAVLGSQPADFTLLDTRERPVRLASLRGKPLLVSFIYTGCFTVCPTQTRTLHEAVRGLDRMLGPDQFNVVSIGFNQPFDSPQALGAFAAQHRIDYPNWQFLSPHARIVADLARAYGFSYTETPAGFEHIVGVTVVDANGRIYRQVYGERLNAEALGEPLRELLLSTPVSAAAGSTSLLERVRLLCTVYDPDTGQYRYNWSLLLQVVSGLAFFLTVGIYLWRERRPHPSATAVAEIQT